MTYIIAAGGSLYELTVSVNNYISQGYEPIGGILHAEGHHLWKFAQALIKRTKQ